MENGQNVIYVRDYAKTYAGKKTVNTIKEKLQEYKDKGITGVLIDLEGIAMSSEYSKELADMVYTYQCTFNGLGNKEQLVEAYLYTGYFIKETKGAKEYLEWFKEQIETADFPLMILDNRLSCKRLVALNVIQPIKFEKNYFHYDVIKPKYLEPETLEKAIKNKEDIYTRETIHVTDIPKEETGFRFACTDQERIQLDIFEAIVSHKLTGFMPEREY